MRSPHSRYVISAACWLVIGTWACAGRQASERTPRETAADSTPPGTITVQIETPADTRRAAATQPGDRHPIVGRWSLERDTRPEPPVSGIQLGITIDSVRGDVLHGRLTHYFSGNVGADPSRFRPFEGSVSTDTIVRIPIVLVDSDAPGIMLVGRLAGDAIVLATFVLGPDTVSGRGGRWLLVRR